MTRPSAGELVNELVADHGRLRRLAESIEEVHDRVAATTVALLACWKPGETKYVRRGPEFSQEAVAITRTRNDDLDVEAIRVIYPHQVEWPEGEEEAAKLPEADDVPSFEVGAAEFPHPDSTEGAEFGPADARPGVLADLDDEAARLLDESRVR